MHFQGGINMLSLFKTNFSFKRVACAVLLVPSLGTMLSCGQSKPNFAITQFSIAPNPVPAPNVNTPVTVKLTWEINTNKTFTAGFRLAPENSTDEALNTATTQAFVDCLGRCLSGTYESICTVSAVAANPNQRFLRCDDPTGLVLSPGRYKYFAGGGSAPVGLTNRVAEDEKNGILEIR
jgi:hypothetical protein